MIDYVSLTYILVGVAVVAIAVSFSMHWADCEDGASAASVVALVFAIAAVLTAVVSLLTR